MHGQRLPVIICLLAAVQVLSTTYGLDVPLLAPICSFLFLLGGLAMAFLLLKVPPMQLSFRKRESNKYGALAAVISLFVSGWFAGGSVIRQAPLTVEQADMLPIIKVMGQRFLAGEWSTVYQPIPEIWNGIQPIYPPVLWGSFLPAVALGFDLRWVTLAGIVLSSLLCVYPLLHVAGFNKRLRILLFASLTVLLLWLYTNPSHNVVRLTEEGVVYCWYCLLVYAVAKGKGWMIGVAATLCLLSRYAMVGWLPAVALWWWITGEKLKLLNAVVAGTLTVLLLLILPFGWKPVQVLTSLPAGYVAHAQRVWDEFPQHFTHSPGMAKFFGRDGAEALHYTLMASSFLVPLLMVAYVCWKRKRQPQHNVPLALLVVQLTVFYAFVDVPYLYLYYTPVFVSLAAAAKVVSSQPIVPQNE